MRHKFLNQTGSDKLIVFFNGWGMDESIINHMETGTHDLLMFYDYDPDLSVNKDLLDNYKELHLVAWSMGVWAASVSLNNVLFTSSLAINGTLKAIDDANGIPTAIFKGTIDNFSERNFKKFQRRMFSDKASYAWFTEKQSMRAIDNQLTELKSIYKAYKDEPNIVNFAKVIIGREDLIFPFKNQNNFWTKHPHVKTLEVGHFPFHLYESWEQLLNI
jgi:biotin synthesis protein BioG